MDGLAIGMGFQLEFHVGIIVAFAVIAHDFSDGFDTAAVTIRSGVLGVCSSAEIAEGRIQVWERTEDYISSIIFKSSE
jgi:hypothetical protein